MLQGPLRSTSARRLILAAAVGGCVLRLAFGLIYWNARPLTHDEREYLALAANISAGRGLVYDPAVESGTGQQFGRAPGYPLFLAAIGAGRTDAEATPLVVKIAQAIVGAAGVWLIGLLALHSGGERAGITAAGIAAVYPSLVSMPSYVLSETLYSTMALGCALMLQDGLSSATGTRPEIGRTVSAGLLAGAGALVRPAMLLFLPIAAVWLFATRRHRLAIAFVLAGLLPIVPWTIRNIRVYDRFVLIASEGGVTFWTGNHPLAVGDGDLAANPEIKQAEIEFRAGARRPDARSAGAAVLSRRSRVHHGAPCVVDEPAGSQGVLPRGAHGTVLCATLHQISGRVGSAVSAPATLRNRGSPAPRSRAAAARGSVLAGRLRRADVPHLFSAGAIQDSRD